MPCYRCGTRQVDPDRGESPWKRGVRGDRQVLICPDCQSAFDWTSDLDRCEVCSSERLVRRLGEVECRNCGSVRQPASSSLPGHLARPVAGVPEQGPSEQSASERGAAEPGEVATSAQVDTEAQAMEGLAREVEQALARVLGRTAGSTAGS
jgi:hypothetical protein